MPGKGKRIANTCHALGLTQSIEQTIHDNAEIIK
jgi:hypothetical protein